MLAAQGMPLEQAIQYLKMYLPRHAILVGQNIHQDVSWLGLKEGVDFAELRDLTGLYRVWNPRYNSWSVFAQDHLVKVLILSLAITRGRLFAPHVVAVADNALPSHYCNYVTDTTWVGCGRQGA